MCDTFRPMFPTKAALDLDDPQYPESWREDHHAPPAWNLVEEIPGCRERAFFETAVLDEVLYSGVCRRGTE
jgi:hypothetical protein